MCGQLIVIMRRIYVVSGGRVQKQLRDLVARKTYGESLQVKTFLKPHLLTSASASFCDLEAMVC
jgi:hypothetical protein